LQLGNRNLEARTKFGELEEGGAEEHSVGFVREKRWIGKGEIRRGHYTVYNSGGENVERVAAEVAQRA
jgi:hypothetical protein